MEDKGKLTAWERWELASLDEGEPHPPHPLLARSLYRPPEPDPQPEAIVEEVPEPEVHIPTAEEIEQIHRQAHESGYQEGYAAGKAQGQSEGHAAGYETGYREGRGLGEDAAQRLTALAARLDHALATLDAEVAEELAALALEVARETLRQTLALRPETVVGVVRDALTQLPHQHANIYLHPDDASLVRNYAGEQISHAGHRIHEDDRLQRNDVLIEAAGAHVDATLATRWRRVVETLGRDVAWDSRPLLAPEDPGVPLAPPAADPGESAAEVPAMLAEVPAGQSPAAPDLPDAPAATTEAEIAPEPDALPRTETPVDETAVIAPDETVETAPATGEPVVDPASTGAVATDGAAPAGPNPAGPNPAGPNPADWPADPIADLTDDTPLPGGAPEESAPAEEKP